ncbi:MAG: sensor histidine kinase [Parachlamydiaceae bacterium]|nr:sensor histidine kinase [Parachlamydiaceae bacterium]
MKQAKLFSIIILALFLTVFTAKTYYSKLEEAQQKVSFQAEKIEKELLAFFHQSEEMMTAIGKEMLTSSPKDFVSIWLRLQDVFTYKDKKTFRWPNFGWINQEFQQVVNTRHGILDIPKDMSVREYTKISSKKPWKLLFAKKDISIPIDISCPMIIPAGMGVVDNRGKFLGIVLAGFHLSEILKKMEHANQDQNVQYALFDVDGDFVLGTLRKQMSENQGKQFTVNPFTDIRKLENTPYTLIAYIKMSTFQQAFWYEIIPLFLNLLGAGLFCLLIRYVFLNRFMKQNKALEISKIQLEDALALASSSDAAKEDLLTKIRQQLKAPFNSLVTRTEILLKHLKKEIDLEISPKKQIDFLEQILDANISLKTLTSNVLDISCVDPNTIIEKCIKIHAKEGWMRGVLLKTDIVVVPPLHVDELRFTQVIVGLIARALRFTRKGMPILLSMDTYTEENQKFLKISILDQGIGITEDELQQIANKYDGLRVNRCIDGTDLDLVSIEKLVKIHKGRFTIHQEWKKGTSITVLFPYSTET